MITDSLKNLESKLSSLSELKIIWLMGQYREKSSNIDLLLGFSHGEKNLFLKKVIDILEIFFIGQFHLCDDAIIVSLVDGLKGGIAVCSLHALEQSLLSWNSGINLEGEHRVWATVLWLPEALCGDLATAKVLYDPYEINQSFQTYVTPYPESLRSSLIKICEEEIKIKISTIDASNLDYFDNVLKIRDIIIALIRLSFAKSKIYFRGFKNIEEQSQKLDLQSSYFYSLAQGLSSQYDVEQTIKKVSQIV